MAMYYGDSNGKAQRIVVTGMQGPAGPQGPQGEPGPQGPAGQGVPTGGTAGQVLTQSNDGPVWADSTALGAVIQTNSEFVVYQKESLITVVANGTFSKTTSTITDNASSIGTPYFTNKVTVPPPHVSSEHYLKGTKSVEGENQFMIIWSCEIENGGNVRIRVTYANGNSSVTGSPTFTYNVWPGTILGQYLID